MQIGNQNYPWVDSVIGFKIPEYDRVDMGYTGSDMTSVTYKLNGVTVCTLTITYSGGNMTSVVQTL
jgi:hypothetical protein